LKKLIINNVAPMLVILMIAFFAGCGEKDENTSVQNSSDSNANAEVKSIGIPTPSTNDEVKSTESSDQNTSCKVESAKISDQNSSDNILELPNFSDPPLTGYITNFNMAEMKFDFDEIEWITLEDIVRIDELGIEPDIDMPGGFYIYRSNEALKVFSVNEDTEYYVIDRANYWSGWKPVIAKEFTENIYDVIPYLIIIKDNLALSIFEMYIP